MDKVIIIESEPEHPRMVDTKESSAGESPSKPLTRKLKIPAKILIPYRLLILVRITVLVVFLERRIRNPNDDARWLWSMSVTCEIWFAFSWLIDQLPKLFPVNRETDLDALGGFESDLPRVDVFVSTADPEKEPPLITANTILSILAADYPPEKLSCYVSDDGAALLTFEALAEAASFARLWVPFCRKHRVEPRNPEAYFSRKWDPLTSRSEFCSDFAKDRRKVKREYDEFKVRINGLPDSIRCRSDVYNAAEEIKGLVFRRQKAAQDKSSGEASRATWMVDGTHWPGTWSVPSPKHSRSDHTGIIQVILKPPPSDNESALCVDSLLDFAKVDVRLPMLVYVSREKRPGHNHNKKAGAMNALLRASAVMSNGPFVLNLDCDHYVNDSRAVREGMCFMMDRGGDRVGYVQFPQRFEGIDPCDRYANRNTIFFDVNMRALDGLQGPIYIGTGCLFRRTALYGFDPPDQVKDHSRRCGSCFPNRKIHNDASYFTPDDHQALDMDDSDNDEILSKRFGSSPLLISSISAAEIQGHNSRRALTIRKEISGILTLAEAINVISYWYEEKTEWGKQIGWIYGSVTEDVVTGYRMHDRGWRSVYRAAAADAERDAFRGTAPINLTDRLHQVLRWATGSVEIFFSRNNALLYGGSRMGPLQRVAYLNVGIYPFTSVFLVVYCFLPALSLFSGRFVFQSLDFTFTACLVVLIVTICALAVLEAQWAGIGLGEWWRNEQFWMIGGTSAHLIAVLQGLLKEIAGIEVSFALTSKSKTGDEEDDDEFADLYNVKWTYLMIMPIAIIVANIIAIAVGVSRAVYSASAPHWARLLGGVAFSFWVLAHFYPFVKGLAGRRGRTPPIVLAWSGLIGLLVILLWFALS